MTATELIENCRLWMRDPHADFHKDDMMLLYANRSLKDIAERSQSITTWEFLPVIEDHFRYALMDDFLKALIVGFQPPKPYSWRELDERKDTTIDGISQSFGTSVETFQNTNQTYPAFYSIGGRSVIDKYVGTVASLRDDGLTFALNNAPDYLFTGLVKKGDRLLNITDGSEAEIIGISPSLKEFDRGYFLGGYDNQLAVEDEVRIVSAEASLHTINIAPPPPKTSEMGEEPLSLYFARSHRVITQQHIDDNNDELELDLEFQSALENRVCYYGSIARYDIDDKRTQTFLGLYESEYRKAMPKVRKRIRADMTLWKKSMVRRVYEGTIVNPPSLRNPYSYLRIA